MTSAKAVVHVGAEVDVGRAVIEAARVAGECGLRIDASSRVATSVSELARNILKYAQTGTIEIRSVERAQGVGVQIVSRDNGPGIDDVERALADHVSSGGTLGLGLPGVRRLMDEFELDTEPGRGTTVRATLWR